MGPRPLPTLSSLALLAGGDALLSFVRLLVRRPSGGGGGDRERRLSRPRGSLRFLRGLSSLTGRSLFLSTLSRRDDDRDSVRLSLPLRDLDLDLDLDGLEGERSSTFLRRLSRLRLRLGLGLMDRFLPPPPCFTFLVLSSNLFRLYWT